MKMVKSLLLGTAAGLVAMTGAQAADLPVKAKPVQYVKICSLYGAGFYYIPGTDMCLKMGGWVRAEYAYGDNGNMTWGWANTNLNNRTTNDSTWRSRGYITADARNQSEYGTVRSYIAVGINTNSTTGGEGTASFSSNRAFIQFAGFTFGLSSSFFDFYSTPATAFWGSYPGSDTGDPGWQVAAYTAQFGGGLSATLSAEMRRMTFIDRGQGTLTTTPGAQAIAITNAYGGFQSPDIVGNLRVDQAWGSAQIMAALHQLNATYYTGTTPASGHPSDKWGIALGAGAKVFVPAIGAGDYLQAQITYTVGAARYAFQTPATQWLAVKGASLGFGVLTDAVFATAAGSSLELTTAWTVNAAYEHFWSKQWRTSLYGGYSAVTYNDTANAILCFGGGTTTRAVCDSNWSTYWIGSRTQYNLTPDTYMGLDVMYAKLKSINGSGFAAGLITDPDNWQFRFRVHKDFYP
jgi:Porin subfamily